MRTGWGWLFVPALALLLLAAHFMYARLELLAALSIMLVVLLFVPRPWAARALQLVLVAGTLEWVRTAWSLAQARMAAGDPYLRMLLILGAVALFTLAAAAVFQHPALRARFRLPGRATG